MSETCRVIINQVKHKVHLVGYLLIRYFKDARYHEHKIYLTVISSYPGLQKYTYQKQFIKQQRQVQIHLYEARLQLFILSGRQIYVANLESYHYSFQDGGLLGHDTVQTAAQVPRFQRNLLQPSLGTRQLPCVSTASHTRSPDF